MRYPTWTAVAAAGLLAGSVAVSSSHASSTSLSLGTPVATSNHHGISGLTATANDVNLANRILYTLSVNVPTGADWSNSEIRIVLNTGTVYNAAPGNGGTDASPPGPVLWGAAPAFNPGAYDTFVNSRNLAAATILGKLDQNNVAVPRNSPPAAPADGLTPGIDPVRVISVAWGNTLGGEDGTFQIAQFTLSADAIGTYFGRTYSSDQTGASPFHTFQGVIPWPEPTGLPAVLLVAFGLLKRRGTT